MTARTQTIEVDEETAAALKTRAAERGVTVSDLVAELVDLDSSPAASEGAGIAELDRRWNKVMQDGATVPNDEVVRWLGTWGTASFRRWHDR